MPIPFLPGKAGVSQLHPHRRSEKNPALPNMSQAQKKGLSDDPLIDGLAALSVV